MKAEIGLWNKEQDGLWSCEWRCGAVILRPQVYRSRAGWRWRVYVNYNTLRPIAQDAEEYTAAYAAARAAIEHLRQWSDQLHKGCISLGDNAATITEGGAA
jgi:hypothetical protein